MKSRGWEVVERVKRGETLVFDGGYGTMLFAAGLLNGACPSCGTTPTPTSWRHPPGLFRRGQRHRRDQYVRRRALKLNEYALGERTRELNVKGARLARKVAPARGFVAGSIGPTSRLPQDYALDAGVTDEEYEETSASRPRRSRRAAWTCSPSRR